MKDDNNQELIRAIDRLTMAVTGGVLVIAGTIFVHAALVTSRPGNGLVGIVITVLAIATTATPIIWLGFKIMGILPTRVK
jgi:hypothetical protein